MDTATEATTAPNSLGLDFEQLTLKDTPDQPSATTSATEENADASTDVATDAPETEFNAEETTTDAQTPASKSETVKPETKERKKPYVNPERVKTGGAQRVRR